MAKNREGAPGHRGLRVWTAAITAAFVAAVAVYLVMLQVEKKMLEGYEQTEVYLAAADIPKGTFFQEETLGEYFVKVSMDAKVVPPAALKDPRQTIDLIAASDIEKGVVVTEGCLQSVEEVTAGMEKPVVAGFRAEDLYQVAGGVLRSGDRIHIYQEVEGETYLAWENLYVQQAFDSSGGIIESGDTSTCAQRFNVFLDMEDVERFYSGLDQGNLRVVKVWE